MFHPYKDLFLNYKGVLMVYCLMFFGLTFPFSLLGEVVAPHRQFPEIGARDTKIKSKHIENRKFSDFTNFYIPEISQTLKGARSSWLALWTNQNELGRPIYQIS
jgi:hypothetical protein